MTTRMSGRHRAAVRPRTPLSELSEAVAAGIGPVTRRTAVFAASSGLVVTFGLPAASATPPAETTGQAQHTQGTEKPAPVVLPTVTVAADAAVDFAGSPVTSVTPPPPPPPPPAPEPQEREERDERRSERSSRSSERPSRSSDGDSGRSSEDSGGQQESASGGSIVSIASQYAGIMYVYGGATPAGFDCSGFTQYVYRQAGISIPRTSGAQASAGRRISRSEARPGDLVWTEGHIGIYAGGNMMWDSPRTGKSVQKREIWFTPTFITYR